MKLIEKLAEDWPSNGQITIRERWIKPSPDCEIDIHSMLSQAFQAGFLKAREMAVKAFDQNWIKEDHNGDCILPWFFKNDLQKMGEEEVE